jgi:hypothetical protein
MRSADRRITSSKNAFIRAPDRTLALVILLPAIVFWAIVIDLAMKFL